MCAWCRAQGWVQYLACRGIDIGRGMRMPLCLCMWYSYDIVQAVIERGSLVDTAGACVGSVCVQCRPQVCATCMAW